MQRSPSHLLRKMFDAAVASAQADVCIPQYLPDPPKGRTVVIGAGKASAAMARALENSYSGDVEGVVVTRAGYEVPCDKLEIILAAHPVPDAASVEASQRVLQAVEGLGEDDLVLCLLSGGGSSLLVNPINGLRLEDKVNINQQLLASGASISEINCVRRHLSAIKGGRLAVACAPARVVNLLISDVPGDEAVNIASGPTVPDPSLCIDALAIIDRYGIDLPARVREILHSGEGESVKAGHPQFSRVQTHLIATPQKSLQAAVAIAKKAGIEAYILSDRIEGEARDVGTVMAGMALYVAQHHAPFKPPCVLLSGGETSVTLRKHGLGGGIGRGGRNVEFLLAMGLALQSASGIYALAGDTDGVDGVEEIAGAILSPDTIVRAIKMNIDPQLALGRNDGHGFFSALGDSLITGPTLTNVNDFRAIYIDHQ